MTAAKSKNIDINKNRELSQRINTGEKTTKSQKNKIYELKILNFEEISKFNQQKMTKHNLNS